MDESFGIDMPDDLRRSFVLIRRPVVASRSGAQAVIIRSRNGPVLEIRSGSWQADGLAAVAHRYPDKKLHIGARSGWFDVLPPAVAEWMDTNLFVHWLVGELSDPATTLSILPHHLDQNDYEQFIEALVDPQPTDHTFGTAGPQPHPSTSESSEVAALRAEVAASTAEIERLRSANHEQRQRIAAPDAPGGGPSELSAGRSRQRRGAQLPPRGIHTTGHGWSVRIAPGGQPPCP